MATVTAGYNWSAGETVTATKLNSAAAPTVVLADGEVTNAKLATGIDASKLTTGTLPIDRIADDAVTDAKLSLAANAGEIKKALNADNSPPIFACRAWVNFNGTTSPPTIRASGNVSSVTKNGTGDYTVMFTTAMPDANYCVTGSAVLTTTSAFPRIMAPVATTAFSTTNCQVYTSDDAAALNDCAVVSVAIFR
jgi:hypothetical protein